MLLYPKLTPAAARLQAAIIKETMIYTCYEMIRDCRADRAEGWCYFIASYVPVIRKLLAHYQPGAPADAATLDRVMLAVRKPEASIFQSLEPSPERCFLGELRQKLITELTPPPAAIDLELETVAAALEPLTLSEKQAVWLETMLYSSPAAGVLLRMAPTTVEKIRARGADAIRGKIDTWSRTLLAENGFSLGRTAAAAKTGECLPPKTFLDMVEGRTTWSGRGELERHVIGCWHCIDHFCRLMEVVELLRGNQPALSSEDSEHFRQLLGVRMSKPPMWKRWLTGKA
jgi:hypothetical protein